MSTPQATARYLSTTETAALVRQALREKFTGVKFSVRSERYAGGSSIRVHWTDGPRPARVDAVVSKFRGADFDGMTDSKSYRDAVEINGERVKMGADFIFTRREITDEAGKTARALDMIAARCVLQQVGTYQQFGNRWTHDLAAAMAHWCEGDDMEAAFRHVVLRETDEA